MLLPCVGQTVFDRCEILITGVLHQHHCAGIILYKHSKGQNR